MEVGERYYNSATFQIWDVIKDIGKGFFVLRNAKTHKIGIYAAFSKHELTHWTKISKSENFMSLFEKLNSGE